MFTIIVMRVISAPPEGSCQAPGCPDSSVQPLTNRFASAEFGLLLLVLEKLSCGRALRQYLWTLFTFGNAQWVTPAWQFLQKAKISNVNLFFLCFDLSPLVFLFYMSTMKAATHTWTCDHPESPPMQRWSSFVCYLQTMHSVREVKKKRRLSVWWSLFFSLSGWVVWNLMGHIFSVSYCCCLFSYVDKKKKTDRSNWILRGAQVYLTVPLRLVQQP